MRKLTSIISLLLFCITSMVGQENLYLIGDACSAGWDAGNALAMTKDGSTFTWTGELNVGELKFLTTQGSWDNCYGADEFDKAVWSGGDYDLTQLDTDRKFNIKLRGTYTLTVNTSTGKINFAWTDRIYPVGSGCSAGWNPSSGQYLEAVNCCSYKGTITFVSGGEFKLLKQQDWGAHFGPAGYSTALDAMAGYDVTADGTNDDDHKFAVSLNGEYDVVLDVYAGKLYVGKLLPSVTIKAQFASNVATAYDNSFNLYYWTVLGDGNQTMTLNEGWYEATVSNVFAPYSFLFNKAANDWEIQTPNKENNTATSFCMHVTNTGVLSAAVSESCEDMAEEEAPLVRPAVYLKGLGDWTGWQMTEAADQMSCTYTIGLFSGEYVFKIYTANDEAWRGADYIIKRDYCTDVQTYSSGTEPNLTLKADIGGNYTFIYYYDTHKVSVIYPELSTFAFTLNKDGFSSVYWTKAFTLPEGVAAYKAAVENDAVVLTEIETSPIPAQTGVVLYGAKGLSGVLTESGETAPEVNDNAFEGTTTEIGSINDIYVLAEYNNETQFVYIPTSQSITLPANKPYIQGAGSGAPLRIRFAPQTPTELEAVDGDEAKKVMRGGQIYIIRNNKVYNVLGQFCK